LNHCSKSLLSNINLIVTAITTAAVCEYPEVKDDVIVKGKGYVYASEGVKLSCAKLPTTVKRRKARSKCLADSTWSVQNFTCSSE